MVTSRHKEVLGVAHLPRQQSQNNFDGERPPINKITIEQVRVLLWWQTIQLEDIQQIIVLAVNIAADCDLLKIVNLNSI